MRRGFCNETLLLRKNEIIHFLAAYCEEIIGGRDARGLYMRERFKLIRIKRIAILYTIGRSSFTLKAPYKRQPRRCSCIAAWNVKRDFLFPQCRCTQRRRVVLRLQLSTSSSSSGIIISIEMALLDFRLSRARKAAAQCTTAVCKGEENIKFLVYISRKRSSAFYSIFQANSFEIVYILYIKKKLKHTRAETFQFER